MGIRYYTGAKVSEVVGWHEDERGEWLHCRFAVSPFYQSSEDGIEIIPLDFLVADGGCREILKVLNTLTGELTDVHRI